MAPTGTRIGIFGGTFDPIHTGHLVVADAVRQQLGLDRLAMVEAAVAGWPGLEASRMEIERGGPSYTIDTVRQLARDHPGAELVVVVGSDVVGGLTTWREEPALRREVTLAVVGRPGAPPERPPPGWRAVNVLVAPFDLSSTQMRERLESGQAVDGLVPESVIRCIEQRGLYATGR
jgi:nicotinate-nucleotide adenylyltransferase